jgi:hypothetical protein
MYVDLGLLIFIPLRGSSADINAKKHLLSRYDLKIFRTCSKRLKTKPKTSSSSTEVAGTQPEACQSAALSQCEGKQFAAKIGRRSLIYRDFGIHCEKYATAPLGD